MNGPRRGDHARIENRHSNWGHISAKRCQGVPLEFTIGSDEVDGNHPLAGKIVTLDVILRSLDPPADDIRSQGNNVGERQAQSHEQEVIEDHRRFRRIQYDLRDVFRFRRPRASSRFAIMNMLVDFRDELATEFAVEESVANSEDLFDLRPRKLMAVLHAEHGELFVEACKMADDALELLSRHGTLAAFRLIAQSYHHFDEHFLAHEARENELITRAYCDDIGAGD